jgi:hypothetical protein
MASKTLMDDAAYFVYVDELCYSHRRSIVNNHSTQVKGMGEDHPK